MLFQFQVLLLTESGARADLNSSGEEEVFTAHVFLAETLLWTTQIRGVIRKPELEMLRDVYGLQLTVMNEFGKILAVTITTALHTNHALVQKSIANAEEAPPEIPSPPEPSDSTNTFE